MRDYRDIDYIEKFYILVKQLKYHQFNLTNPLFSSLGFMVKETFIFICDESNVFACQLSKSCLLPQVRSHKSCFNFSSFAIFRHQHISISRLDTQLFTCICNHDFYTETSGSLWQSFVEDEARIVPQPNCYDCFNEILSGWWLQYYAVIMQAIYLAAGNAACFR